MMPDEEPLTHEAPPAAQNTLAQPVVSEQWPAQDASSSPRYFWSGWFDGQTFFQLASLFILLSLLDLISTLRLMDQNLTALGLGTKEGNSLANYILERFGQAGFVAYKFLMVAFILGIVWTIYQRDARRGRYVLWFAIIVMSFLAILHLSIMSGVWYMIGLPDRIGG